LKKQRELLIQTENQMHTRRFHEISLLIAGLAWLDIETAELLVRLYDHLGCPFRMKHDIIQIGSLIIPLSVSMFFGVILIHHHRSNRVFLPVRSYLSYTITAVAWSILVGCFVDEVSINKGIGSNAAYFLMWILGLLTFLVPWLVFRFSRQSPVIIDAFLLPVMSLLMFETGIYFACGTFARLRCISRSIAYFTGPSSTFLVTLILLSLLIMTVSHYRNGRRWKGYVICFAISFILWFLCRQNL